MVDSNPGTGNAANGKWLNLAPAQTKLNTLFMDILEHPGFGELHVNVRIMKDARKEVILNSGKEYRFVLVQATSMADEKRIV
ncbi:MAG: hypothetical protein WC980_09965 [Candidatus Brocadiia bacterium]